MAALSIENAYQVATRERPQSAIALKTLFGHAMLQTGKIKEFFSMPFPSSHPLIDQKIFGEAISPANNAHIKLGVPDVIDESTARFVFEGPVNEMAEKLTWMAEDFSITRD